MQIRLQHHVERLRINLGRLSNVFERELRHLELDRPVLAFRKPVNYDRLLVDLGLMLFGELNPGIQGCTLETQHAGLEAAVLGLVAKVDGDMKITPDVVDLDLDVAPNAFGNGVAFVALDRENIFART